MAYLIEIFVTFFCICVAIFCAYLGYIWFLKKFRGYRFKDGVPDVALLRQSSIGSTGAGAYRFSCVPFVPNRGPLDSTDGRRITQDGRPHTFPLDSTSRVSKLPEIRVELV